MFPTQSQVLNKVLSKDKTPTKIHNSIEIYAVEDLPCNASTAISAIGYKASEQKLYIQWKKNQNTSCYDRVPDSVWQEFLTCTGSLGRLYHQVVNGTYGSTYADNNLVEV